MSQTPGTYIFGLAALLATATLSAQEFRGTFSGSVLDAQGAAVANVKIVATETRMGTKCETSSDFSGHYVVPFLTPGEYQITAEAAGFKRFVRQGLTLSADEQPVIDIRLEVGAASESVTVSADVPLIESANGSLGQVITTDEVEDLPLNGRMPMMLMQLALGVISTGEPGPVRPFDTAQTGLFSLGGAPTASNEFLLNGGSDTGYSRHLAYPPPQDAVQEVRIHVFESDASFGHSGGGTANQITKGGTNTFHGSLYEFNQVSKLDANYFFINKNGVGRPLTRYNQYGLTAGAPIWIPKVFNGKNRVFWFFAWEGLRDANPTSSPIDGGLSVTTVPTTAERKGDFSALLNLNKPGTSYAIYDPNTGVPSGAQTARTPFPNNAIPASRLNPIALNYMQYYPLPNIPGQANGLDDYGIDVADKNTYDTQFGRIDINVSDKHKISFDVRHNFRNDNAFSYFHNLAYGEIYQGTNGGSSFDDVYTFSPTVVTDIRANWTRFKVYRGNPSDGFDPAALGFPSYLASSAPFPAMPYIQMTNFQPLGASGESVTPYDCYQLFGEIVKTRGNHAFKAGSDIRDQRESNFAPGTPSGSFTFGTSWTNGPLSNAAASPLGQDLAAFLLGLPTSGSFAVNTHSSADAKYYAFFVQDDWRAARNLTLNLGLRWEHETPTTERYNRATNGFDPTAVNPVSAPAAAAYANNPILQVPASQFRALGGLNFASASHPDLYNSDSYIFSPRFGFAWVPKALGGKTVIRGGLGVFASYTGIYGAVNLNQQGFSQTTQFVATNNNYLSPTGTLSNPFPGGILQPAGAANGSGTFLGQQITYYDPDVVNAYSVRWNLGIQRQLPGQMVLEVAYIANHAVHLPIASTQLDYVPRQYLSTSPLRDTATINLVTGSVTNPFKGLLPNTTSLNGATVARNQLLIPFPQYPVGSGTSNGVIVQNNAAGSSYYQSLNVRLQKRFTNGVTLINNFVWSNLIERATYLNDSDAAPEKRIAADSRPLREVLGATYELPAGTGKRFTFHSRIVNAVLGNWATNALVTFQLGPPLAWGNVIYYGGPLHLNSHQPDAPAFDVSQFNTVSSQQLADNIRTFDTQFNNLRRDPTKNLDASMLKKFQLRERMYLQLRFEGFNISNRVTFSAPSTSPTSSAFGLVTNTANTPRRIQMGARLVW